MRGLVVSGGEGRHVERSERVPVAERRQGGSIETKMGVGRDGGLAGGVKGVSPRRDGRTERRRGKGDERDEDRTRKERRQDP